jgi:8-oxo-dGTP pyrophosphatase MutT (NUDIX family)
VRLRDPTTRLSRLFVPGGAIEPGEQAWQTAERETLEETGYRVRAEPEHTIVASYPFEWDGALYQVTTCFVRARLVDAATTPLPVNDADFHEGVCWIDVTEIPRELGFHPDILSAVSQLARPA